MRRSRDDISARMPQRQRGNVILTVMLVMFLSMLGASALVTHNSVAEAREIEQSLAKVRAYWAMMGHLNYAMSRARYYEDDDGGDDGLCYGEPDSGDQICEKDSERVTAVNDLLGELGDSGVKEWSYEGYSNYTLNVAGTAADDDGGVDGKLKLTIEVTDQGGNALLQGLKDRVAKIVAEVCYGVADINSCGDTDTDADTPTSSGRARIDSFVRRMP